MLSDDGTFLAEYNYIIDDDEGLVSGGIVFNYSWNYQQTFEEVLRISIPNLDCGGWLVEY